MNIKFRAYHKEWREIRPVGNCPMNGREKYDDITLLDERGDYNSVNFNKVILMQCTGLKDKNGAEIYEGDIVRITALLDADKSFTVPVIWDDGTAGFKTGFRLVGAINMQSVVIGNIYQNPELIKEL